MNQHARPPQDDVIPAEMRRLLHSISDDKSVEIVARLLRNGRMRFGEIKDVFGLSSSSLSGKLKKLQNGGLVVNFYAKGDGLGHSYYEATEISELVFDSLYNIMYAPDVPPRKQDAAASYSSIYHLAEASIQGYWPNAVNGDMRGRIRDGAQGPQSSRNLAWPNDADVHGNQYPDQQRVTLEP